RKKTFGYFKDLGIPGPEPSIIWGNLAEYQRNVSYVRLYIVSDLLNHFAAVKTKQKTATLKVVYIIIFLFQVTMRTDQVHPSLGESLIHAKGSQWRFLRSCPSPEFTSHKLKQMMPYLVEQGDIFINQLDKLADERREESMLDAFQALSMDFICRAAFGIDTDFHHNKKNPFYVQAEGVIP
ncbi:cytochrome P450, putative, partial [Ixodes scapularis]